MKRRKRFILAVCISAVLTISIAGCNGNGINSKKDSAVVTPGKSGTDTSPEKPSELLNTVWEVTEYLGQEYPKGGTHLYIYIGPDGHIYDAETKNGGGLKRPDIGGGYSFAAWTLKNGNFVYQNKECSYKVNGDELSVEGKNISFKAKKVVTPTGEQIKNAEE
ncbi:hypothetical protein [Treponema pedis]|uniref:Lipoprotein n=1 Tax=Treponema pedis TaxID=409322 RepID=A0A7S7AVZ4_9SPIR|nr:hypothetical protein [Treponema pedis]QOW60382.1 hypothetical protein IFE08_11255 [Treponema pedis]